MSYERPWTRGSTQAHGELRRASAGRASAGPASAGDHAASANASARYDVFLAHVPADTEAAEALYRRLWRRGLRVFLDTKSLRPWDYHEGVLAAAQAASSVTAVLISEHADRAFYGQDEVDAAVELAVRPQLGRRVVPVYLGQSGAQVPHGLRRVQSVSASEGWSLVSDTIVALFAQAAVEAPTPAGPRVWSPRVPLLPAVTMPRADLVARLDVDEAALVQVLVGPAGMGKSTAAALYVWQCRQATGVDVVWWVRAQHPLTLVTDLAELAPEVGVPAVDLDVETVAARVLAWLETTGERWILVLDDAMSPTDVERWLPAGTGRVVITSRDTGWAALADQHTVTPFDRPSSIDFLAERTGDVNPDASEDTTGLGRVAARLGGLPLALEQAASVMDHPERTWGSYSRLFNEASTAASSGTRAVGHEATAATTTHISLDAAIADAPLAARLAAACGFLAADAIPFDLFADPAVASDPFLHASVSDVQGALDALCDYALAVPHGNVLRFHTIVQDVARDGAPADALDFVARTLRHHFPDPNLPADWPRCAELAPHVLAAAGHSDKFRLSNPVDLWWIVDDLANYHLAAGNIDEAVTLHEAALALARSSLDVSDLNLITARNNLALSYQVAGRTDDAIGLQRQVLSARERVQGANHPDTLAARNNLAGYYAEAGRTDEAIGLQQQVLADTERLLGVSHPDAIAARSNLASYRRNAGRVDEAIALQQEVLADLEQVQGVDHPDTLAAREGLASYYAAAGRTDEAIAMQEQVLADCERLLGADHPETLRARAALAHSYLDAGHVDEARALHEQVLVDRERVLGVDHPETVGTAERLKSFDEA